MRATHAHAHTCAQIYQQFYCPFFTSLYLNLLTYQHIMLVYVKCNTTLTLCRVNCVLDGLCSDAETLNPMLTALWYWEHWDLLSRQLYSIGVTRCMSPCFVYDDSEVSCLAPILTV